MENASKALIIAGSVLIAILLIAMGVRVFSASSGTEKAQEETMKAAEISTFNSRFTQYVGSNKSRAQVVAMLNAVISNNAATNTHKINDVNGGDPKTKINNNIPEGKYTVKVQYDSQGYIYKITTEPSF